MSNQGTEKTPKLRSEISRVIAYCVLPLLSFCFVNGCTIQHIRPLYIKAGVPKESIDHSRKILSFWEDNQASIDHLYSKKYCPTDFIVDTDLGAMLIQELLDPEAVEPYVIKLGLVGLPADAVLEGCLSFLRTEFRYGESPDVWPTALDTLSSHVADCKGLSLLLMSMLLAAGVDSYCAISNGHMWVCVSINSTWTIIETAAVPKLYRQYDQAGIYQRPLYKIYMHRSFKRCRR
jgi:hypothetical protein